MQIVVIGEDSRWGTRDLTDSNQQPVMEHSCFCMFTLDSQDVPVV